MRKGGNSPSIVMFVNICDYAPFTEWQLIISVRLVVMQGLNSYLQLTTSHENSHELLKKTEKALKFLQLNFY